MCGRYSFNIKKEDLKIQLPGISLPDNWIQNLNICPTEEAFAIFNDNHLLFSPMKWGFKNEIISKNEMTLYINARSETIFEKKNFKNAILNRRCILPADSFYEWGKYGKSKIPYRIMPSEDQVLFMAGIWQTFEHNKALFSAFVIITTQASDDMSGLHNRMPVILNTVKKRENWLSAQTSTDELINMMKPTPNGYIKNYPVSNMVNNIKVKTGDLHAPINSPLTLF